MTTRLNEPPAWVQDAVFYQIFPDRFARSGKTEQPTAQLEPWDALPTTHGYKGGDLLGIVDKLDWLVDLGVNALYLNPIFQSGSNHRYHTHDYYRVDPLLGGGDAFDELVEEAHARDVRVVLDGVFNHASRGFFQFHDILENGPDSPWIDWFRVSEWPLHPYDETKPANYEAWWGLKALPAFNTDNPDVREYLMRVAEHWARKGIDGWRLDVPGEITTPGFWEEFRSRVRAINPDLYIVGELWGEAAEWVNRGNRFDATMNYQFTGPTIAFTAGRRVDPRMDLDNHHYEILPPVDAAMYGDKMRHLLSIYRPAANTANLNLLDSHDTARILTIAGGDRTSVELALVLLLTFPGPPCIYYGTEVGLPGGRDPDCRRSFPWDRPDTWDTETLETVTSLTRLRHEHAALRAPDYQVLWPDSSEWGAMLYLFRRGKGPGSMVVAVNAGEETESVSITHQATLAKVWGTGTAEAGEHNVRFSVPGRSAAVWRQA